MERYQKITSTFPILVRLIRFLFSGGIGATVDLVILYGLTDYLKIWYLVSAIVAFIVSYIVSFILQKFWTFQDNSRQHIHIQVTAYMVLGIINLSLNTLLVYLLVNFLDFHYLFSQIIASVLIAGESYFIYRYLFRDRTIASPEVVL